MTNEMTHRERFFAVMNSARLDRPAFFPDITDWYAAMRTPEGQERTYGAGGIIPDGISLHQNKGSMPDEFADMTFLDFYRRFDWGLPIHGYKWCDVTYTGGVERTALREGNIRTTTLHTPKGDLIERHTLAADGSWAPTEHLVKELSDLDALRYAVEHTHYSPRYDRLQGVMDQVGQQGVTDLVLHRSPFGKLVHEYMGFERVIYALFDHPEVLRDFMAFQEERDLAVVRLAADAPAKVVIMSDHTDENLISPVHYCEYCIPYYQKMNAILHRAGKCVSTHLDGNFKAYFPMLSDTGFDLLDGCTPAPMMNYEVEELAAALPATMRCYLGVPATLFCQRRPDAEIVDFGRRILDAFGSRAILNIGDILPPNGDIRQVIKLGRMAAEYRL